MQEKLETLIGLRGQLEGSYLPERVEFLDCVGKGV